MTTAFIATAGLLADNQPHNTGPDFGKASPIGLLIIILLLIVTFTLVWSMNRHLKKLPESFDRSHPEPDQAADDGTVGTARTTEPDTTDEKGSAPREPGG